MILVSCTPVEYPSSSFSSSNIEETVKEDPQWRVEKGSKSAIISFSPLEGVDSYSLLLSSEKGEKTYSVLPSSFSLSRFSREIKGLSPDTEYTLSLLVEAKGEKMTVEKTFSFQTESGGEDKLEYAPYAYCVKREENSAVIHFNLEDGLWYRMVLREKGEDIPQKEFVFSSSSFKGEYEITGLEEDKAYILGIEHGKKEGEWSVFRKELEIKKYTLPVEYSLSLDGSRFSISPYTEENEIYLLSPSDPSFYYKVTSAEFTLPSSTLPSMTRCEFYTIDSITGAISNRVSYSTPIKTEASVTPSSITLKWIESEEALYFVSVEAQDKGGKRIIPDPVVGDVERDGEEVSLEIGKLVSNTNYSLSVTYTLPDGTSATKNEVIKTDSYVGTYAWLGYPSDGVRSAFWVDVKESPEGDYPYYITISETDPAYDGNKYQVMPLIDDTLPSYAPIEGNIKYSDTSKEFMKAYRWNAKKWNKTTMSPSEWRPESTEIVGDSVTSIVYSKAMGMNLYTKTQFSFRYVDGKKELVFTNKGEGANAGFVNMGLFTNKNPSPGLDKYSFVLTRIEGGEV